MERDSKCALRPQWPTVLGGVLLLAVALAARPADAYSRFPPSPRPVQCLVAPCSTPECKAKCDGFKVTSYTRIKCVDNYIGGCNCDCCLEKEQLCNVNPSNTSAPCCSGTICDFTTACVSDPRTKCGTICVKPEDALSNCKALGRTCDPTKVRCCPGSSCQRQQGTYRCAKCKGVGEKCSASKPCCPRLTCVGSSYGGASPRCRLVGPQP